MNAKSLALLAILLVFLVFAGTGHTQDKRPEAQVSYQVPTSGKILDVMYHPEFDEWWIKCREGDSISVYSYEPRSQKWGKVSFVPGKKGTVQKKQSEVNPAEARKAPDEKIKNPDNKEHKLRPENPKSRNEGKGGPDLEGVGRELKNLAEERTKSVQPAAKKQEKKAKWWDIRRILRDKK
jgi:hypothetical protein